MLNRNGTAASIQQDGNQAVSDVGGDQFTGDMRYNIMGGRGNVNNLSVTNYKGRSGEDGFTNLCKHIAENAMHNSSEVSDQPQCHPGTRETIIQRLLEWTSLLEPLYLIEWVHGPAGSGKSSILRTVTRLLFEKGLLLGSFFFFQSSERRNTSKYVISTLAYQLALHMPETKQYIEAAVEKNPKIFALTLWDQALSLIISPFLSAIYKPTFRSSIYPRVIVVDGLDECSDRVKQCELLDVLRRITESIPMPINVLITSRPEYHIRKSFDSGDLNRRSSRLALDDSWRPDQDIEKYLRDNFEDIRQQCQDSVSLEDVWPSGEILQALVSKASGQFIYAATIIKFIASPRHDPVKRLDIVRGVITQEQQNPFEELDNLYSVIFQRLKGDLLAPVLRVLGFLLVPGLTLPRHPRPYEANSPAYIEDFLGLNEGDVRRYLFDLESLLFLDKHNQHIQLFYTSLSDYLFNASRSGMFWINPGVVYADIFEHTMLHLLTWPDVAIFMERCGETFFKAIRQTSGLIRAIESCDFKKIIARYDQTVELRATKELCPIILQVASKTLELHAFRIKLLSFQNLVASRITVYFTNINLKTWLVTAILQGNASKGHLTKLARRTLTPQELDMETNAGFAILKGEASRIIWCLTIILNDPDGQYFMDATQYAIIALHLIRHFYAELELHGSSSSLTFYADVLALHITKSTSSSKLLRKTRSLLDTIDELHEEHGIQLSGALQSACEAYIWKAENKPSTFKNSRKHKPLQSH